MGPLERVSTQLTQHLISRVEECVGFIRGTRGGHHGRWEVGGGEGDIIGLVFLKDHPPTPQFKGTRSAVGKYQRLARRGSD